MYGSSTLSLAHPPSSVSNPDALSASHPYPHPQKGFTQIYPSQGLTSHRSLPSVRRIPVTLSSRKQENQLATLLEPLVPRQLLALSLHSVPARSNALAAQHTMRSMCRSTVAHLEPMYGSSMLSLAQPPDVPDREALAASHPYPRLQEALHAYYMRRLH